MATPRDPKDMTDTELAHDWNAGMILETQVDVWEPWMEARLKALEAEIDRRGEAFQPIEDTPHV